MDSIVFAGYQHIVLGFVAEPHYVENHEVLQPLKDVSQWINPCYLQ